ncbi:hypothetical protein [Vibrio mangrovi]|uniref:Flavodoxin n=1 Tax=Vibrio mangrovi TaxID=474394 RepID=A0A1Y6IT96_9VIBR|nr:hypothetical protein [Vibrio mangrovi]MDW6004610.1 flavodoxin [Vibrio mangrovi]SMS00899.1 hypothetical protein VIM7927_02172 [Vibrio mangrovi]
MNIAQIKNQWLSEQVEVEFPTPQSLVGRKLYLDSVKECTYQEIEECEFSGVRPQDVFRVDFHRLTVMFAQLQARQYADSDAKEAIIEFFTQIIYSPPCELYLGFENGEPVAAGILTRTEQAVLVSDLFVLESNSIYRSALDFAYHILKQSRIDELGIGCWAELTSVNI